MLIYNGDLQFDITSGSDSANHKVEYQNSPWENRSPHMVSHKRLAWNRVCALILLIGINALTYLAVRAMITA